MDDDLPGGQDRMGFKAEYGSEEQVSLSEDENEPLSRKRKSRSSIW